MNNESPEERNVIELWQGQKTEGVRMSVEQIRLEAGKFERGIKRRNLREYLVALFVILFFAWSFARAHQVLPRVGFGLIIAAMCYLVWHLLTKGSPGAMGEDAGRSSWIEFRRAELMRQRDLLRTIWRWYLGPMVPGIVVVLFAAIRGAQRSGHAPRHAGLIWTADVLFIVAVFWVTGWLNTRGARRLQLKIDELDEQGRD